MDAKERARKNESMILSALASVGQRRVAELMGCGETVISKQKSSGDFEKAALMLAHLGLKVVPVDVRCFDPAYVENLRALAQIGLKSPPEDQLLSWDD